MGSRGLREGPHPCPPELDADVLRSSSSRDEGAPAPGRRAVRQVMASRRLPLVLVALAGVVYVASVVFVSSLRITFPYDVEWMEGSVLMQAERFTRGEAMFPPPSATFVPFFYPPLYPALLAI